MVLTVNDKERDTVLVSRVSIDEQIESSFKKNTILDSGVNREAKVCVLCTECTTKMIVFHIRKRHWLWKSFFPLVFNRMCMK